MLPKLPAILRNTNRLIKGKTTLNVTTNNHFEYMEFFDEVNLDGEGNQILVQSDHPPGKVGWDGIAGYIGHMTVKNGATLYLNEGGVINRTLEADHIQIPKGGITDLKHGWTGEEKEADRAQSTLKIDGNCITKRLPWAIDDDAFIPGLRVNGTVEGYSVLNCDENTKYSNGTDYYYYVVADASETGGKAFKEPEGADYKVCYRYLPNGKIGWYLREHPVMKLENKLVRVGTGNNGEPINEYYMIMHVDMKGFAYEWSSNSDKNRVDFFWDIYEGISANNTSPIRREVSLETLADISNHLDSSKDIYFINPVFDATGSDEGATDESHQYKKLSAFDVVLDKDPVRKPRYYSVGANFHYTDGDTYNDVRLGDTTDAARCVYDFAKEGDLQFEREVKKDSIMTTTPYADGTKTQGADTALLRVFLPYGMNAAGFTISEDDNHFRFTENADIDAEFTSPSAIDANYELADVEIANSEYAVTIGNQDLGEGTAFAGLGSATKYDCTVFSYKKVNITDITPETEEGLKLNLKLSGLTRNSTAVGNGDPETVSPGELRIQTFPLTYKITYNVNVAAGGTGTAPKDEKGYVYNELATVAAPDSGKMFHTSGKAFAGWNTKKDGTGETYMPGTQLEITQDTTLYAMWSSETFAVQKVWNDYNDAIGLRPPSVAVQLEKAEGDPDADGTYSTYKPVGNPVVLNESNNWRASFPVTKGELMKEYRVVEVNTTEHPYVPGYQAKVTIPYAFQVTNTLREAEFFIKKVDKESQKALANAIFRIQRLDSADGTRLTEYYTDVSTGTNGLANFEKLAVGKYELLEAKAPVGYKRVKKTWTIEITDPNTNWTGTQQLNISVKNSNGETINLGDNNTLIIEDEKVTELPPVGGMGRHLVTLFAVGFTVLALYGRVLYCRRKRGRRSR